MSGFPRLRWRRVVAALIVFGAATGACAGDVPIDLRRIDALVGDAGAGEAKSAVCAACHGAAGISAVPIFPNLAGQRAEYLYWSLRALQREQRADSPMTAIVAGLSNADLRDLATYYGGMPAPPPNATTADDESGARTLYLAGDPARGVPPCQGCHGVDARGNPRADAEISLRAYPALRRQRAEFVVRKLADYRDGKHHATTNAVLMSAIARTLDDRSMRVLASWLESMPP